MKRPSFLEGAIVAFSFALVAGATLAALGGYLGAGLVVRALVMAMGGAYLLYLLARSGERIGRVSTAVMWGASAVAIWAFAPSLGWYLGAHVALIWLARSIYYHRGLGAPLADLGLCALALIAGVAAANETGSAFLSVWTFFLVQALFVALPASLRRKREAPRRTEPEHAFERAYRSAEAALRRLAAQR
jgi:hypothetical protein